MENLLEERTPRFYGAATVGKRGQVVIPAEARKEFGIAPTTKLLVFGNQRGGGLILTKAEFVTDFLTKAMALLANFDGMLKSDVEPLRERQAKR